MPVYTVVANLLVDQRSTKLIRLKRYSAYPSEEIPLPYFPTLARFIYMLWSVVT
jgi:hypothetical protein